jgi:hypothetical protein
MRVLHGDANVSVEPLVISLIVFSTQLLSTLFNVSGAVLP